MLLLLCTCCLSTLAQKNSAFLSDSLRCRTYLNYANKLGAAKRDSALFYAEKALQLALSIHSKYLEANSYQRIGILSAAYGIRVDNLYKALRIYEQLNSLNDIGELYMHLFEVVRLQSNGKYSKEVLEYAEKAVEIFQKANSPFGVLRANNNIGIYYAVTNNKELAYQYFEKVKKSMVALKMDSTQIMQVEYNLANLLSSTNREESLRRRLVVYAYCQRTPGWPVGFALLEGLCQTYSAGSTKSLPAVIRFANEGLQKAVELQNLGRQVSFHQHLQKTHTELRDFEQALVHADKVRILSDSLSKQQDAGQIAEAQQKYENEKKQAEIEKQRRELLEKQLSLEQVRNQKALLDRELALKTQHFATETAQQQLKELRFLTHSQRQKVNIQQLRLMNLNQESEKQLLQENQRITQIRMWFGAVFVLILFLVAGLLWRNRLLSRKNTELQAAVLQGQTKERQRVAADLHDNLGTTLSSLQWSLSAIDPGKLSAPEQAVWATLRQQVDQAYTDVRLLSHNLLPDELAKQGLPTALQLLVTKLNRNKAIHFSLDLPTNPIRYDLQTEFELYSICLELCTNILKHAQATQAQIVLATQKNRIHLTVSDNGLGLSEDKSEGRGLQNIRARAEGLGGNWTLESGPGVVHHITVPLRITKAA